VSTAAVVSTATTVESVVAASSVLPPQAAKVTIPATNKNANVFFIFCDVFKVSSTKVMPFLIFAMVFLKKN
jgi:hypothetical protein